MRLSLPKQYTNKIVKAIAEFSLIEEGDNILVGLSGGKDSAFLLYALRVLQKSFAINFGLSAMTVDLGFQETDLTPLQEFTDKLNVPYYIEKTRIAEYIQAVDITNPCAKCAHFRRGAMVNFMKKHGFNKMAYGHHYNDAVETFLMSIIYSGQIIIFQPMQYLSDNQVYIIRPLVYLKEKYIKEFEYFFNPLNSPCPYDGQTKREEIKDLIFKLTRDKNIFYNLTAAMREDTNIELWPAHLEEAELVKRMKKLWGK